MSIAILGWGSLIWDRRDLPITGEWQRGGPVLPRPSQVHAGTFRERPVENAVMRPNRELDKLILK